MKVAILRCKRYPYELVNRLFEKDIDIVIVEYPVFDYHTEEQREIGSWCHVAINKRSPDFFDELWHATNWISVRGECLYTHESYEVALQKIKDNFPNIKFEVE